MSSYSMSVSLLSEYRPLFVLVREQLLLWVEGEHTIHSLFYFVANQQFAGGRCHMSRHAWWHFTISRWYLLLLRFRWNSSLWGLFVVDVCGVSCTTSWVMMDGAEEGTPQIIVDIKSNAEQGEPTPPRYFGHRWTIIAKNAYYFVYHMRSCISPSTRNNYLL